MKKIKQRLLKARSFLSIKTYKHPMVFVISLMIILNIIILCIAALIALGIDDSFDGFIDAFANGSLKWMLTPNAVLQITNPKLLVLAVTVLVIGMILFTGTIIALTTNAIKEYFQKKKSGSGKIYMDQHIVVLNWNNKVPELVADLLYIEEVDVQVAILAEVDKEYAEKLILNAIHNARQSDKALKNFNVLVKNGNPLLYTDLDDISIEKAKSILVMNKDYGPEEEDRMAKADLNVIKVILSLGRIVFYYKPPIVAEIKKYETKEKINTMSRVVKTLKEHILMPICFDRRLGQIIAQTIICPKMEDVYLSLFSFEDSEIYMIKDMEFEDCLNNCSHSIPVTKTGKDLFVLSLDSKTKGLYTKNNIIARELKVNRTIKPRSMDVFIVGTNNKLSFIMQSFKEYESLFKSDFNARYYSKDNLKEMIETINELKKQTVIVLLSDETQELNNLDANVIEELIYIQGGITRGDVDIIVELLDPHNDHIIKDFNIENTIISNKIISLLLSKLALYKETAPFYENLLTIESDTTGKDDQNIFITLAKDFIHQEMPLKFSSVKEFVVSIYYSSKNKYVPLGYIRNDTMTIFEGDMTMACDLKITSEDSLILFKI